MPRGGATILTAVSELAAREGLKLKELHLESGRLDEVFRTITAWQPHGRPHGHHEVSISMSIIMRRELASYFATPLAYVFILIFLVLANLLTFFLGGFFERGQADLAPFFGYHPWLYLFLIPAISMRLWAEERKSGSIELLMTQPVTLWEAVLGKFLAAWIFTALALALTFPHLDHGQLSGQPRQRRDRRRLPREPAARRRLPGHRLVHVGADAQPGGRVHSRLRRLLRVSADRLHSLARRRPSGLGADPGSGRRLAVVPTTTSTRSPKA